MKRAVISQRTGTFAVRDIDVPYHPGSKFCTKLIIQARVRAKQAPAEDQQRPSTIVHRRTLAQSHERFVRQQEVFACNKDLLLDTSWQPLIPELVCDCKDHQWHSGLTHKESLRYEAQH